MEPGERSGGPDGPARAVVLVEGISDQIAVETLAGRLGRDLAADGVVVVPIGGAHAVARQAARFLEQGTAVAGLCDAGEERAVRRGLAMAGLGDPRNRDDLAGLGFFVCVADLEDELIRAAGQDRIEALLAAAGDAPAFRTLQHQPVWRDRPFAAQMHRFLGAGARRKPRYAGLLLDALPLAEVPGPLRAVLDHV